MGLWYIIEVICLFHETYLCFSRIIIPSVMLLLVNIFCLVKRCILVWFNNSMMNKIMKQRWKLEAIEKCDVMVYTKIFLKFPYRFWPCGPEKEFFMYAHEQRGYYTFWQVCLKFSLMVVSSFFRMCFHFVLLQFFTSLKKFYFSHQG